MNKLFIASIAAREDMEKYADLAYTTCSSIAMREELKSGAKLIAEVTPDETPVNETPVAKTPINETPVAKAPMKDANDDEANIITEDVDTKADEGIEISE